MARGRRRAATRVNAGTWSPHPGWRHFIPAGRTVLVDQRAARERVERLVAAESWREDRGEAWKRMLLELVHAMDWRTGVITGLTAAAIGAAGNRAARTVTEVIRWAKDAGLLVVIEEGASAEFLGSKHNRTPSYVLLADPDLAPPDQPQHQLCDLPQVSVGNKPLPSGKRLETPRPIRWPSWQVPQTPSERHAAVRTLSRHISLDRPGVSSWRLQPLLRQWWEAGWSISGLLYAIDHHPDQPDQPRGDALRGATDPIRVLGHRLRPWTNRLADLPAHLVGLRVTDQATHTRQRATADTPAEPAAPPATPSARQAARAHLAAHLAELRRKRRSEPRGSARR